MRLMICLLFLVVHTLNISAQLVGVTYDGVRYLINTREGWAMVDTPSSLQTSYSGDLKVRSTVWETGKPNTPYTVLSVGNSAFANSPGLRSVELPPTITTIADNAFYNCPNLTQVNIPESVTSIGANAFRSSGVTASSLPSSLMTIGIRAFYESGKCPTLKIPAGVTDIGDQAFYGTGIERLYFTATNCNRQIGDDPFPVTVKEVVFSEDVSAIPDRIFDNLYALEHVYSGTISGPTLGLLPSGLKYLGISAFRGCKSLFEISLPSDGVTTIMRNTFSGCKNLRLVRLPYIKIIKEGAFYNCENISSLELGENLTIIEPDGFGGLTMIDKTIWTSGTPPTSLNGINSKVNIVPNEDYMHCGLQNDVIIYPNLNQRFDNDGVLYVMSNPSKKLVDIIGCTFNPLITSLDISEPQIEHRGITFTIDRIMPYSFAGNYHLSDVTLTGLADMSIGLFKNCESLSHMTIPETATSIYSEMFMNTGLDSFNIPINISTIGDKAFYRCSLLQEIEGGRHLESIGNSAFENCILLSQAISSEYLTQIKSRAFYGCAKIQSLCGIDSLTEMGPEAFYACRSLTEVILGKNVRYIGEHCFDGCDAIKEIYSYAIIPPTANASSFNGIDKWNCTLHIPHGTIDIYSEAEGWKEFLIIEDDLESGTTAIENIFPSATKHIRIFNLNGNLVFEGEPDFAKLRPGVYILDCGNRRIKKFIF